MLCRGASGVEEQNGGGAWGKAAKFDQGWDHMHVLYICASKNECAFMEAALIAVARAVPWARKLQNQKV